MCRSLYDDFDLNPSDIPPVDIVFGSIIVILVFYNIFV